MIGAWWSGKLHFFEGFTPGNTGTPRDDKKKNAKSSKKTFHLLKTGK